TARTTVLYGPTEAAILASAWPADGPIPLDQRPLGRPLPGARLEVRDADFCPVPLGAGGELWISGPGVARGYLGRPDLTADRFMPAAGGGRAYRTGDLARHLPDGRLAFLGRADQQVKIRGIRIEPGEVEAVLLAHTAVAEAAVLARGGERAGATPHLAAYLVPEPHREIPLGELKQLARERLSEAMIPTAWAILTGLPLTPNGKVDRRALAKLGPAEVERAGPTGSDHEPPTTPTEELLAGIWASLLGLGNAGRHDNFFAAGGHSLLATQAVARIRETLGVELPVRLLFELPTPALLAPEVERRRASGLNAGSVEPLRPAARGTDLPLSFSQERLWLLDQLHPGSDAYNLAFVFHLDGPLVPAAWEASLNEIRRRHEVLRTRFRPVEGGAVQEIAPPSPWPLSTVDLAGLPLAPRQAEVRRLGKEEATRPLDLAAGPHLRTRLLRLGPEAHLCLLTLHHAVADGWSLAVLLTELRERYAAFASGNPPALPQLPIQYADYALWQRRWLQGEVLERQLAYWRCQLAGDSPLTLPFDRKPSAARSAGAAWKAHLPASLGRALLALSQERGTTLFMTLFAGFAALLARGSGETGDAAEPRRRGVTLGTPIANRNRPELFPLIGFFANTLALHVDLAGDPTVAEILTRVRAAALGAYDHQDLPFETLVAELRPERRLDENPLFQTAFSFNLPLPEVRAAGLTVRASENLPSKAKFHLALAVTGAPEDPAGLTAVWEYRQDLFDSVTLGRWARRWETLLTAMAISPEARLSDLPLLAQAEIHQLRHEWNDTSASYPQEATLPELFEHQVALRPDAVALTVLTPGARSWTYRELDRRAAALARHLATLGVRPGSTVAVALPRSFELILGLLAILKAGGAYVPLDLDHPAERQRFLLTDTGAKFLLTLPDLAAKVLPAVGLRVVDVASVPDRGNDNRDEPPRARPSAEDLAYILHTSGSTGVPKGVAVSHRNVVRLVEATTYARFHPEEVFLQLAPAAFDASTFEIWGPLLHGGRLVVAPPGRASLTDISRGIREGGVTTLWLTAGLFHQMVDEELSGLSGLRQLLAGGDVVSPTHARTVLAGLPGLTLIDGYGPTEGTTFSCCQRLTLPEEVGERIAIGRPIANTRAHVLDPAMRLAPIRVPGELYLGGDGLARGYLGRPDLTAERFLPDPFTPGGRLYRTGDRVRLRHDGRLDYLGRNDFQVKLAGHRIEPGEIEATLGRHPEVRAAAVLVREDDSGQGERRHLVAYVVLSPDANAAKVGMGELERWLRERLPEALVPHRFVVLDRLPLNANGKLDRAGLPAPSSQALWRSEPAAETYGATEEILARLWEDLLGLPRVGPQDDFFALGGHSLLGTRLLARLRRAFEVELPLAALFEDPTLQGLARRIDALRAGGSGNGAALPEIQPLARPAGALLPAAPAQRRLWFLDRLSPGGFFLNIAHGLALRGPLDGARLERSLAAIVARHEALRTSFATVDGQPVQRIAPPGSFHLPLVELSGLPDSCRRRAAREAFQAAAQRPADLERGPLFWAVLLRRAGEPHPRHDLLLVPHHLIFDGASRGIFSRELEALYNFAGPERGSPLPPLALQYADFAAWQQDQLDGPSLARQRDWWREKLAGLPSLDLPTDRPRPPVQRFSGGFRSRPLAADLDAALLALCRRQGVTLFMALLALFEVLLSRSSGQADFGIGAPISGRGRPEVEDLIGFFVNTLVLRADLSRGPGETGGPTFAQLLSQVRQAALDAYAHQDLPFESLVLTLRPERHLDANPLFDVALSVDAPPPPPALSGLAVTPLSLEGDVAYFDLTLIATRLATGLQLTLNYRSDLFSAVTAERQLDQLAALIHSALAAPETPIADLV
ncbi:MAG TPA: amino acid adenylation domain-containing protein, partial [Thermoanaerobaculia bacterium]|nr:amino acid adenylation domain-containing protein [Thermoanaerobaculia bacterium]